MAHSDLTTGNIRKKLLAFALPLMAGNVLYRVYNLADTLIVGRFVGAGALAAVGAAYALMVFINSVQFGLCMGCGVVFSMRFGAGDMGGLRRGVYVSFVLIALCTVVLNAAVFLFVDELLHLLCVPPEISGMMRTYLLVVFAGIFFTFLYNFTASLLRAVGDSLTPLLVLAGSVVLNVVLDVVFVCHMGWGVAGAAWATTISQVASAVALVWHVLFKERGLLPKRCDMRMDRMVAREMASYSFLTCLQQSVMNLGILLVQGLVNSFGVTVMAAFAAAVRIDTLAYLPAQDFGNAFSTFIAQNHGAGKVDRLRRGVRLSVGLVVGFCLAVSVVVLIGAEHLMAVFVPAGETEVIAVGARYLRIEGAFYMGIGLLFLFYGYYRAIGKPGFSVVLTVVSLGTRVALAYALAVIPAVGVDGIWWSVPIGWALADVVGAVWYWRTRRAMAECRR